MKTSTPTRDTDERVTTGPLVVVQIACHNEAETLPRVLDDIPRKIPGVGRVAVLVIDDGSDDDTAEVARLHGADHVLRWPERRGLAQAFSEGLSQSLRLGADAIVHTDADHQYRGEGIPRLLAPILEKKADICVGVRPIDKMSFSLSKRLLQRLGSLVVRMASGLDVRDAPSGFRAFSRTAALRLTVISSFSYTLETLIQAKSKGLAVSQVDIEVNPPTRPSRLARSVPHYVSMSAFTIARMVLVYFPVRIFGGVGMLSFLVGLAFIIRFVVYYLIDGGQGHVQSLVLASSLVVLGTGLVLIGMLSDLIAANRNHLEEILHRLRSIEARGESSAGKRAPELPGDRDR